MVLHGLGFHNFDPVVLSSGTWEWKNIMAKVGDLNEKTLLTQEETIFEDKDLFREEVEFFEKNWVSEADGPAPCDGGLSS